MANPTVDVGTGCTIVFGTSAWSAEITDFNPPSMTRETIDTTHQGTTGARTHDVTDLYDGGEFSMEVHLDPNNEPPIGGAMETVTITFPDTQTMVFTAGMTGFDPTVPLDGKMVATATFKISGTIDWNASS